MTATVAQISTMLVRSQLNGKAKITLGKFTMVHLQYQYRVLVRMFANLLITLTGLTVNFALIEIYYFIGMILLFLKLYYYLQFVNNTI